MLKTWLITAVIVILALGTGAGSVLRMLDDQDADPLPFTFGTMSEDAYRERVQTGFDYLSAHGFSVPAVCETYRSLTPEQLDHTVSSDDPDTRERAVEILFAECAGKS